MDRYFDRFAKYPRDVRSSEQTEYYQQMNCMPEQM